MHVGFAMSRIDMKEEAKDLKYLLRQLGEAQTEIEAMRLANEHDDSTAPIRTCGACIRPPLRAGKTPRT